MSEFEPASSDEAAKYLNARRVLQFIALGLVMTATVVIGFLPSYTATSLGDDGQITSTTTNGFQNLVNLSPYFVGGMVLALLATVAPLVVRGRARSRVSAVAAILLAVVTVASIVLIGNWLLAPPAIVAVVATLLPQRPRERRIHLVDARA